MSKTNNEKTVECKKQHIVPQFLQNEFSSNGKLFRHTSSKSFGVKIADNYAENYYYSEVFEDKELQEKTLDKRITRIEGNEIVPTFKSLLTLDIQKEFVVDKKISELIYHFYLRNKSVVEPIIDTLINQFKNFELAKESSIDEIIDKFWLRNLKEFSLNSHIITKQKIKDNYPKDTIIKTIEEVSQNKLNFLRTIHEKALEKNSFLMSFKFKIIDGFFVLPDNVLTCYSPNTTKEYLPIIDRNTEHILFPIAKNKLLIAYKDRCPQLNISKINEYLVSSSNSFSSELPETDNLVIKLKTYINKTSFSKEITENLETDYKKNILYIVKQIEKDFLPKCRNEPIWRKLPIINKNNNKRKNKI